MKSTTLTVCILSLRIAVFTLMPGPLGPLSQEAIKAKLGTISQEAQNKLEEDTAKKEAKAEAKADAARKKKLVRSQNLIEVPCS